MSIIDDYPQGLGESEVIIYNETLKSMWLQEHMLLNRPKANFRSYTFTGTSSVNKNLIEEFLDVEVAVPDLTNELIVDSGGIVLPSDRFITAYDVNPNILSEIEWPAGSGNIFSIRDKEYNPRSGRLELRIRQGKVLKGVVYRKVKDQSFGGSNWKVTEDTEDLVITVNRDVLSFDDNIYFSGISAIGDITYWVAKDSLKLADTTQFIPSARDYILDTDPLGNQEVYQVIGSVFDPDESFYRILARRPNEP